MAELQTGIWRFHSAERGPDPVLVFLTPRPHHTRRGSRRRRRPRNPVTAGLRVPGRTRRSRPTNHHLGRGSALERHTCGSTPSLDSLPRCKWIRSW